ncbi:hypothetical protein MM326_03320 [Alkalihalobacillus sp. LMS6]|uniref:hypothetical protein n=1 Tax=Alkalihalobacillus sp. LMS6 TaxID=2924034 RepID=UPI0020D01EFB|nr:hypothetical protein [Alkalihalobacillus sp. LMS6]UTR07077.1 hypothetical protein MM326_03320 [Alkalihalobacillus sp. LMS6]
MKILMFCEHCGNPKILSNYVLKVYIATAHYVYCDACQHENEVTSKLRRYAFQLRRKQGY